MGAIFSNIGSVERLLGGKNDQNWKKWKHFVLPWKRLRCVWSVLGSVCELNLGRLGRPQGS